MARKITYTAARANFAALCDRAGVDREVVLITMRNSADVALISAKELSSLLETAHLLRSPKNAKRLMTALNRAKKNRPRAKSVDKLRREIGLGSTRR